MTDNNYDDKAISLKQAIIIATLNATTKFRKQRGLQWMTLKIKMRAAMRKTKKAMTEKTMQ